MFLNVRLLGASEIAKTWRMRSALREDAPYEWSSEWLPLTEADGDYLCLDRKSGRVLELRSSGRKPGVVAPPSPSSLITRWRAFALRST